ncbi:hypothetical protein RIF29_29773 [Crotalaria pallida]|uniref:Uncharacterized protein n=1 Tax=Crotalaria pallida TaxID=3830 RepID=A0AAN9I0P8_CROPI
MGAMRRSRLATLGCSKILVCVAQKDSLRDRGVWYYDVVKKSGWQGELQLFARVCRSRVGSRGLGSGRRRSPSPYRRRGSPIYGYDRRSKKRGLVPHKHYLSSRELASARLEMVKAKIKAAKSNDEAESLKFTQKNLINRIYTDSTEAKIPSILDYVGTVIKPLQEN